MNFKFDSVTCSRLIAGISLCLLIASAESLFNGVKAEQYSSFALVLNDSQFALFSADDLKLAKLGSFAASDRALQKATQTHAFGGAIRSMQKEQLAFDPQTQTLHMFARVVPVHTPGDSFYGSFLFNLPVTLNGSSGTAFELTSRSDGTSKFFHQECVAFDPDGGELVLGGSSGSIDGNKEDGCVAIRRKGKFEFYSIPGVRTIRGIGYDSSAKEFLAVASTKSNTVEAIVRFDHNGRVQSKTTLERPMVDCQKIQFCAWRGAAIVYFEKGRNLFANYFDSRTGKLMKTVPVE